MLMNALPLLAAASFASATKVVMVPRQVSDSGPSATPSVRPEPLDTIGNSWEYVGCASDDDRFPGFQPNVANDEMDLEFCAASCETEYFGVSGDTCYCGTSFNDDDIVSDDQCDIPCPGNPTEACGGRENITKKRAVPAGMILSVYQRNDDPGNGAGVTATITATVTETGTVTACPGTGDCTTGPYTSTRTVTTLPGATCGAGVPGNVVCYGSYCIFDSNCEVCQNKRVVCNGSNCNVQECGPEDEHNRLVICDGEDCKYAECTGSDCEKKVVCVGDVCSIAECFGDECKKNLQCQGEECNYQQCTGEDCYSKVQCQGEECNVVPACNGDCPVPSKPEVPTPGTPAPPAGGNQGPAPPAGGNQGPAPPAGGNQGPAPPAGTPEVPPFSGAGAVVPALMGVVAGFVALL